MPNLPPLINSPSGSASAVIASAIAKQRSARLHLFQSEIQSRIQRPPTTAVTCIRRAWKKFDRTVSRR